MLDIYKPIRLLVVFVIIFFNYVNAQQKEQFQFYHKALYEVTYLLDSLDQDSQKKLMTELLMGDGVSLFRSTRKAESDSSYMAYINTKVISMNPPTASPIGEINAFNYQILKNFSSKETKVYDEYTGGSLGNITEINYYYEPEETMSNWTLSEDTATINGYLCQRADIEFGGRYWTAWFSPEHSMFSDGPYKFKGLPGLIFKIHDAKKTWNFDLVDLSRIDTLVSINFKETLKFTETTKQELYKNRRYYQKNKIDLISGTGGVYVGSKVEGRKRLEEYILHDNNWIEL